MDDAGVFDQVCCGIDPDENRVGVAHDWNPAHVWRISRGGGEGEVGERFTGGADFIFDALRVDRATSSDLIVDIINIGAGADRVAKFHGRLRFQNAAISASETMRPASRSSSPSLTRRRSSGPS
jgi:hypothetical protein